MSIFFKSFKVVHFKPTTDRLQQLREHVLIHQNDDNRFKNHWPEEATIPDKFEKYRSEFLDFLRALAHIYNGHICLITTAKHFIGLTETNIRPVHNATYRAGPTDIQFLVTGVDRILQEEAIELVIKE